MKNNIFVAFLAYLFLLTGTVFAQEGKQPVVLDTTPMSEDKERLYKIIADDLRCPTCTGLSTLQSSEDFSVQIRNLVREQVREGKNQDQIMAFFTERYGNWILREPPKSGFHLLAWGIPGAMMVFGPFFIWFFVWRRRKTVSLDGVRSSSEILEEMESELKKLRGA